ncbi:MAG: putative rane protein [Herbinix sp.]|jgi:sporulation integral membrane protein YlbJ|nr:putative rane protein [Herbinix sp.]
MNYIKNMKNKFIKGFIVLFLILMILFPHAAYEGASSGLLLWFHNILPNLLPFIIVSNLMIRLNITKQVSKLFYPFFRRMFKVTRHGCYPIVLGFLSGIPMGAKSTADLITEKKIEPEEGLFLFSMCNNASPMFIIGYITITQLKLPQIRYALFVILYGSAIISGLLFRSVYRFISGRAAKKNSLLLHTNSLDTCEAELTQNNPARFSFRIVDNAITNGFEVITKIGGYIILFSILAHIVNDIGPDISYFKAFLMGILEITIGINQICNLSFGLNTKIVLVAVLTSFGGISGMAQTKSVIGDTRLSMKYYFFVKLFSAVITFVLASIYVNLISFT